MYGKYGLSDQSVRRYVLVLIFFGGIVVGINVLLELAAGEASLNGSRGPEWIVTRSASPVLFYLAMVIKGAAAIFFVGFPMLRIFSWFRGRWASQKIGPHL